MNAGKFKDPLCYLCHTGTVIASWFLTQEVADLNTLSTKYSTKSVDFT